MLNVTAPADCGNAPKKRWLLDFNIAFARGDLSAILEGVTDDVEWIRIGKDVIRGKDRFAEALALMKGESAKELVIDAIITHGNTAAANGTITFHDGRTYAFCDVYRFNNHSKSAKLKAITSYVIGV